jgi:hypothetical protein
MEKQTGVSRSRLMPGFNTREIASLECELRTKEQVYVGKGTRVVDVVSRAAAALGVNLTCWLCQHSRPPRISCCALLDDFFFGFSGCFSGLVGARVPGRTERNGAVVGNALRGSSSASAHPGSGVDHGSSKDMSSPWMRVLDRVTMGKSTQEADREARPSLVCEQRLLPHDVRLRVEALLAYRSGDLW